MRRLGASGLTALVVLLALGCATGSVRMSPTSERLERPPLILVRNFQVDPSAVAVPGSYDEKRRQGEAFSSMLAAALVRELNLRGIEAGRTLTGQEAPSNAAVVDGSFLRADPGSAMGRWLIGFGVGQDEVVVQVRIYQMQGGHLRRIDQGVGQSEGDRMPGMVGPGAVAGVAGKVFPIIVGGAVVTTKEATSGFEARLDDLAKRLADSAVEFYGRRGWRL